MAGKFETFQGSDGKHYFRLKAGNGEQILASQGYQDMSGCENGIESVRNNCGDDNCYERKESKDGKSYFNIKATNGQVIGTSQMYKSESGLENGIQSCKTNGPDAPVVAVDG